MTTTTAPTPTPTIPTLEADRLSKRYEDGVLALDSLCLAVHPGEIYVLLGGNGAGKSTAIHLFLDFIRPTSGEARIGGTVVAHDPLAAKSKVGYVSENVQLYGELTAVQNLQFFARLAGLDPGPDQLREVLLRVGLQPEAHRQRLKAFSKGMRQKTGLAIAVLEDAPALLLDEPSSGLDPRAAWELSKLLGELRDEGKAILMSSHDLFRAKQLADRLGIMNHGRLILERTRKELEQEDLETLYLEYVASPTEREAAS